MSTVVVGGGLIGLTTAYVLQSRGASVVLVDANDGVALETSFANGGLVNPSMPEPWNGPGVFRHLTASLFNPRSSMRLRWHAIPSLLGWGIRFLQHSSSTHFFDACSANYELLKQSIDRTMALADGLGLEYCRGQNGTLSVFRAPADFDTKMRVCRHVADAGLEFQELVPAEIVEKVPALAEIESKIYRGIFYPGDEHGDAHLFCRSLLPHFEAAGGQARFGVRVRRLRVASGKLTGLETSDGDIPADRVIVAAGTRSPALLETAGLRLPVKPVKGYSVTVELDDTDGFPAMPVIDDSMHACVTPFGNRLRMVGTAEFTGFNTDIDPVRTDNLYAFFEELFPSIASRTDKAAAKNWAGLRPMSYDGKPFIGASRIDGLWVNSGHGPLGWALAMGSAHLLADIVLGHKPSVDPGPFDLRRIRK